MGIQIIPQNLLDSPGKGTLGLLRQMDKLLFDLGRRRDRQDGRPFAGSLFGNAILSSPHDHSISDMLGIDNI